jgi:sugar-specific transcriptional regulator TrmB
MPEFDPERLMAIGLSKYEACAYLALLGHDDSTAVEVADRASVPRQRIYDILNSLRDKGLIVIKDGRPVRLSAHPPAIAFPAMLEARLRHQTRENERLARLVQELILELETAGNGSVMSMARMLRVKKEEAEGGF